MILSILVNWKHPINSFKIQLKEMHDLSDDISSAK